MSPTLLEGAIAVLLVGIAIWIGIILAAWLQQRARKRSSTKPPPDQKNKPPYIIDI